MNPTTYSSWYVANISRYLSHKQTENLVAAPKCANQVYLVQKEEDLAMGKGVGLSLGIPVDLCQTLPPFLSRAPCLHFVWWHLAFLLEIIVFHVPYIFFESASHSWMGCISTFSNYSKSSTYKLSCCKLLKTRMHFHVQSCMLIHMSRIHWWVHPL